jgi:hypothetical protein
MARTPLAGSLALALLLATGCAGDPQSRDTSDQQRHRPGAAKPAATPAQDQAPLAPSSPPAERRTTTPDTPQPTPQGNALTIRQTGPDGHLLRANDLGAGWSVSSTGSEHGRVMSDCHRATLRDVGAQQTRLRDFAGPGAAVQAVARFVDSKSAWRIEKVVGAWADDCADELRGRDAALGAVRQGSWVSVVEISGVDAPRQRLRSALAAVEATF